MGVPRDPAVGRRPCAKTIRLDRPAGRHPASFRKWPRLAILRRPDLSTGRFGGTFGGPILKDKLHVFASVEWNRETRGVVHAAFVPTEAERAGNFSGPAIRGCTPPAPIDPLTGQPFGGNRIPPDRLSPAGLLFLQLYPLPNTTPREGSCNNWVASLNSPINWLQGNVRVDYALGSGSRLMVRYTQDRWQNDAPAAAGWGDPFPIVDERATH